jgi:putative ABC transport system permease protein
MNYTLLLALAFAVLAVASLIAILRHTVVFRIFIRNGLGNKKRLALIIAGLMIGSAMISGALVMRSTMLTLSDNLVALTSGHIDETVTSDGSLGGPLFSYGVYTSLLNASPPSAVRGLIPMIYSTVSVFDNTTGVPYDDIGLVAQGGNSTALLGPFVTTGGEHITTIPSGYILMDQLAASQLSASPGNTVTVFAGRNSITLTLLYIIRDNYRGYFDYGYNIFMSLGDAQKLLGNGINMVAVTNAGTVLSAASKTPEAMAWLNASLPAIESRYSVTLKAHAVLQHSLDSLAKEAGDISDLYLALSLFAVASGMILVVVIFYMLAEERIKELGLLRALGARRNAILSGFLGEGFVYTLAACTVGSFLGIGIGYVMVYGFVSIFGSTFSLPVRSTGVLLSSFTVTASDISTGFFAGSLVTYAVVLLASYRISSIASVQAIRGNIPPAPSGRRFLSFLILLISFSISLFLYSYLIASSLIEMLSISLLLLSSSLIAQLFKSSRLSLFAGGLSLLLFWALPYSWHYIVRAASYYIYVESGIFLVVAGLMLFMSLSPLLLRALSPRGRSRGMLLPTLRQALAYPSQKKLRTALSMALFSFVIFGIISVSVLGTMIDSAAVRTVQVQGGGYNFVLYSSQGLNLTQPLDESNISSLLNEQSLVYDVGAAISYQGNSFVYPLVGIADFGSTPFYSHNSYPFYARLSSFSTPQQAWNAVQFNSSFAIIDMTLAGIKQGDYSSATPPSVHVPLNATLTIYSDKGSATVRVIGILNEFGLQGIFVSSGLLSSLGLLNSSYPVLFLKLKNGVSSTQASVEIRHTLYPYDPVLVNLELLTEQLTAAITGIVQMTEIFIALGLAAGTAGLGIMSMRSVIERYQQIGLLRALGFSGRMIAASFLLEFLFLSLFGSAIGVAMALLNSYIISERLSSVLFFSYSPATLVYLILISLGLTAAAVVGSARTVARIQPSAALRYIE